MIVTDFEKSKDLFYASMLRRFSTRSVMALPIIADGQKFGAIIIGFNRVHHFNEEEQALAMQAASQFSLVMSKTRAVNDARRRAQESENLRRAMSELTSLDDLDIVLNRILLYLREVVPLDSSTLFLMENGRLIARAVYGTAHPEKVIGQTLPETDQFYQIIQQTLHPVILEDAQNDPRFIHWGGSFHVRSWMGVPLLLGGKTIGMLTIDHRKPGMYRQENAELAQAFTSQAALAVHNARLYAAERMRAHALEALNEATTALVSTLEIKELLNRILAAAISAIPTSSRGMLILMDPDGQQLKIRAIYGFSDPLIHEDVIIPRNQYLSQAFYQGKPLIIPELDLSPDELINHSHGEKLEQLSSAIVAPLMNEDVTVGAISLYSQRKDAFDDGDLRLLESFASMAASAIHNAQLHAEVQRISITDPLTGVFNRRGLIEFGLHEVERTKRFHRRFSAIMFDIDRFKRVNDTYGHVQGDRVLASLAGVSSATLRDADLLGRFGGEEFVALLPETGIEGAGDVAERLRKRVEEMRVSSREGDISITISLGVVEMTPQIKSLDELLTLADYALYRAKEAGRNCVVAWTDED
jgi:diguanylate cyclase (GGDEF)-like protein